MSPFKQKMTGYTLPQQIQAMGLYPFFRFSIKGNRRIKGNSIHPSRKFGFTSELIIGFPQLDGNFLKQIIMIILIVCIGFTNFVYDILIGFEFFYKIDL